VRLFDALDKHVSLIDVYDSSFHMSGEHGELISSGAVLWREIVGAEGLVLVIDE